MQFFYLKRKDYFYQNTHKMISDILSISTCFELNNDPKNFLITDLTDFASESIALTDVAVIFKIVAPDGSTAYKNSGYDTDDFSSPDIDHDVSTSFNGANLPLDSNGDVQVGNYSVYYKLEVTGATQPGNYSETFKYEYCHVDPEIDIDIELDCFCGVLTSTDNTDYGTEQVPIPDSITRTHTGYPPPTSGISNQSTSNKLLTVSGSNLVTQTWTLEVSSIVQWTYPDGLIVKNTLSDSQEIDVECDLSLCDIFCCINTLVKKWEDADGKNSVLADQIKRNQLDPVLMYFAMFKSAAQCGQNDKAQSYYNKILDVSNCDPGCGCTEDGDTPQQVVPVCSSVSGGDTVVTACGNGAISVTSNTVGSTTTYTVCFDDDLLTRLNELFNTTIIAGANITVTPTVAGNGDIQYRIDASAGLAPVFGSNRSDNIDLTSSSYDFSSSGILTVNLDIGKYLFWFDGYIQNYPGNNFHLKYGVFKGGSLEDDSYREIGNPITGPKTEEYKPVVSGCLVNVTSDNTDVEIRTELIIAPDGSNELYLKRGVLRWMQVG